MPRPEHTGGPPSGVNDLLLPVENLLKFIFSWFALPAISVIVSGKLLRQQFPISGQRGQLFRFPLPRRVLDLSAKDHEVPVGFAMFFVTFFLIGVCAGKSAHLFVRDRFGIDPGQWSSLLILSSLASVVASVVIVLTRQVSIPLAGRTDPKARPHRERIQEITEAAPRGRGGSAGNRADGDASGGRAPAGRRPAAGERSGTGGRRTGGRRAPGRPADGGSGGTSGDGGHAG